MFLQEDFGVHPPVTDSADLISVAKKIGRQCYLRCLRHAW